MYLYLLLLISPAFGMPSSTLDDLGGETINELQSLPNFIRRTEAIIKNPKLSQDVAESLKEAENAILEMALELKLLETEDRKFENYFPEFNKVKQYLRESRQSARKLADRTVKEIGILKVFLKDLDENNDIILLEASLDKMKDLMIETLETLKEALEKYISAQEAFENLNSSIAKQNREMEKLVTKDSDEYKKWVEQMKAGAYGVVGRKTVAFIIGDIFGCRGICSAVKSSSNATTNGTIESEKQLATKLEKLKALTDKMVETGKHFDTSIREVIDILTDEVDLINNWTISADDMNKNIDKKKSKEVLKEYSSIKTMFVNGLNDLQNSAEEFLLQRVDILM